MFSLFANVAMFAEHDMMKDRVYQMVACHKILFNCWHSDPGYRPRDR